MLMHTSERGPAGHVTFGGLRVDGRRRPARRFRALVKEMIEQLGGADAVTVAQLQTIQRASGLIVQIERLEAKLAGDTATAEEQKELRRLTALQDKLLSRLRFTTPAVDYYGGDNEAKCDNLDYVQLDAADDGSQSDGIDEDGEELTAEEADQAAAQFVAFRCDAAAGAGEVIPEAPPPPSCEPLDRDTSWRGQTTAPEIREGCVSPDADASHREALEAERQQIVERYRFLDARIKRGNSSDHVLEEHRELERRYRELAAELAETTANG